MGAHCGRCAMATRGCPCRIRAHRGAARDDARQVDEGTEEAGESRPRAA